MRYLFLVLFVFGCTEKPEPKPKAHVLELNKGAGVAFEKDSLGNPYWHTPGVKGNAYYYLTRGMADVLQDSRRYWFIRYSTKTTTGVDIQGSCGWASNGIINYKAVSDFVYHHLSLKRQCYQYVLIDYIYEFKDSLEKDAFFKGDADDPAPKKHRSCLSCCDTITSWGGPVDPIDPGTNGWILMNDTLKDIGHLQPWRDTTYK